MEAENSSLTQQLNEKSSMLERFQTEILKTSTELEKKKKEVLIMLSSLVSLSTKL